MSLLVYNKTTGALNMGGIVTLNPSTAAPVAGARGKATNLTAQLTPSLVVDPVNGRNSGLTAAQFATLDTYRATNKADFEWTSSPEYLTTGLFVNGPLPGALPLFSETTRPAANEVNKGYGIWNTTTNAPEYSNGVDAWFDAVGNRTS